MDGAKGKDEACKDRIETALRKARLRETHRSVEAAPLQNLFCRLQPARIEPTKAAAFAEQCNAPIPRD